MGYQEWEFKQAEDGQWRWTRTLANGEIVGASTESYHNFVDCERNAAISGYDGGGIIKHKDGTIE